MRTHRKGAIAAVTVAAVAVTSMLAAPAPAVADPLSPMTGARVATSGNPSPGPGGTVYYVDSVAGSNANSGTSPSQAWQTLASVTAASFVPGDVIAFKRGQVFSGSATIGEAGTAGNVITVTAYGNGAQPIIENPGGLNMLVLDAAHLRVSNVAFRNGATFRAGPFDGTNYRGSGAVVATINADAARVVDSTFTNVGVGVKTYGDTSTVWHNTFKDLQIAYTDATVSYGAIGVSANNDGIRIAYNDFINCRSTNSPYGADGGAVEIEGFTATKDDISIDHNYSRGSQGFLEVTETQSSNVSVQYNVSNDYQQFIAWDTTNTPEGYFVANNTVVRHENKRLFNQFFFREEGPDPAANWATIQNNIFGGTARFSIFNFPHHHNVFNAGINLEGYALGSGDIVAAPRFVDVSGGDLRLNPTSPAIDNGAPSTVNLDLDANPVGIGRGVDMGAFEYQNFASGGSTLISDGGFESQTTVTTSSSPWFGQGTHAFGVDVNAGRAHSGQDNGWTATTSTGWGALTQTVAVTPNSHYRLTVWVQNSTNLGAWLGAKTTGGAVLNEIKYGHASGYTRYILTFNSRSNTSVDIHAGFFGKASTTAWQRVDDVRLQKL